MNDESKVESKHGAALQDADLLVRQIKESERHRVETSVEHTEPHNRIEADCELITPRKLTLLQLDQQQIDSIVKTVPGGAANVQDMYPLSPLQEGMLFHHLLNPQSDSYLLSILFELQSGAHIEVLTGALQKVIGRHDALRTAVLWENLPSPVQVVYRQVSIPVEELVANSNADLLDQIKGRMLPPHQNLDLSQAPLLRLLVARGRQGAPSYGLLQIHHLVCDYQSWDIVVEEVMACLEGREQFLPEPVAYRNYVAQVRAQVESHDDEAFFTEKFGAVTESTAPFDLSDVHGDGSRIQEARQAMEPVLAQRIRSQARRHGVSAARLFHAAWGLVVAHTSGRDEVVFGTVLFASRHRRTHAQNLLGVFINTLPLRLQLHGVTVSELIEQTHRELGGLLNHQSAPLALAQRCSGMVGTAPLFTALLNYRRSSPTVHAERIEDTGVRVLTRHGVWTNYPVTVSVDDQGEGFVLTAQTDPRIDPRRVVGHLQTAVQSLADALEHSPNAAALTLNIVPPSERCQIVEIFNATHASYPQENLIHELIEEHAQRIPSATAVICADEEATYAQLNQRANQVAHALWARGVRPDERVALYAERSVDLVAGLLGILKAGGAYVPMDVSYPLERLRHMLGDSAPVVLLTQERLRKALPMNEAQVLTLDGDEIRRQPCTNHISADLVLKPQHLAYVIYTSGSTGIPKGVAIEHRNLMNLVHWQCAEFDVTEGSRCSSVAAVGFDAAGWEIWPPLSTGATLVLAPAEVTADVEKLLTWWSAQSLDVSFLPTPMAEFVFSRGIRPPQLRTLLVGGDRLRQRLATGSVALVNNYGPTEATVVATSGRINGDDPVLHIGKPIANTQVYILNVRGQVVPIGVAGEIFIGGAGIARGYLNRPELTAERFVADPFSKTAQARLYRTGDMGRWRTDGTVEYLGRNDHQVKIRGYRIELGEIETQLATHALVKDAVVVARMDIPGEQQLVAYFTSHDEGVPGSDELRTHLRAVVPDYMVPTAFVLLDRIPLTPNGKVDARALPAPEFCSQASHGYELPQGGIEERLARIWQQLLQVKHVSRRDNFFERGGHSLLAVNSLFKINQAFGTTLKVTDIYRNPTLQDLAMCIGGSSSGDEFVDLSREAVLDEAIAVIPGSHRVPAVNVLMTGATGFVGRFLLAQLLKDTDATVYCLVRGQSAHHAHTRLRATLTKWNLWSNDFETRVVAIAGNLGQPRLGVGEAMYRTLEQNIDCIYHCATSMNHLESYQMAKPTNVDAARQLLKLATSQRPKLVNYISTLSVFSAQTAGKIRVVDEAMSIDNERHLSSKGYIASKWVGEKIFMTATERGIPCNIFRVGLVWADTQEGRYDDLQHGYRVFKSCLLSGHGIENFRYQMIPTPVDYVARAIVFLGNRHPDGNAIFHIASPSQSVNGMFECCNEVAGTSLELIPHYDWICEMKRLHYAGLKLPAVPLIEFAFSMDEESFNRYQRSHPAMNIRFDCSRTHRELEAAGIVAPELDDEQLRLYVMNMIATDADLQDSVEHGKEQLYGARGKGGTFGGLRQSGG